MKFLLDTHVFIWWDSEPEKLSNRTFELCQAPENQLILSVASLWEIQIKSQLGKIKLNIPLAKLVEGQQISNGLLLLPVNASHVYALGNLPSVHKDPFDRMIVAQARVEALCLISHDTILKKYPIDIMW